MYPRISFRTLLLVLLIPGLLMFGAVGNAADLKGAKSAGWLGEQQDGYLGLVRDGAPADMKALRATVNKKRRARYADIAKRNGISIAKVATLTAKKAIKSARSGDYVKSASGQWVRTK